MQISENSQAVPGSGSAKDTSPKTREMLRRLYEQSTLGMAICNDRFLFIAANPAFCEMLGYSEAELSKLTFKDLTHPDYLARDSDSIGKLARGEIHSYQTEKRYITKSGTVVDGAVTITTLHDDTGKKVDSLVVLENITQRKRLEEALRKSEDKYRAIFENTTEGIFQVTPDGRLLTVNPALARSLGYASVEELCSTVTDIRSHIYASPDDRDLMRTMLLRDGFVNNFEVECRKKGGGTVWIQLNIRLVKDNNGNVLRHEGVGRDITGHKRAERALEESETRFRKIIEQAPIAMAVVSMDGTIEFINNKAVAVFGYRSEEIPTMDHWWILAYPDEVYRAIVMNDWTGRIRKALAEGGEIAGNEYRVTCKTGGKKIMFISGVPVANKIFVMFDDVTERRQAEDALRLRESYLSAIIENQPGLLWLKDPDGKFLAVNTRFSDSSGLPCADALVGKTDFDIWPAELAARYVADDKKVMESRKPCIVEEPIPDRGTNLWFETFKAPIFDGSGAVIGTTGNSRDITERKRAEMALLNSQKLESLGILAGGIAHDFNNLLTGIYGYMDLALFVSKDPQLTEYFERMLATMNRAKALTMQLLTFAKGGAPVRKITSLIPFVQETARFALCGSNVSCRFVLADNLWPCNIDKNQIGQVIDNIVINAQQAMPGGGTIEISAVNMQFEENGHPPLCGGDYVRMAIKDSGIGIPKEILPRIFDPFYTTKLKGHGLGLATCHSVVHRHGGCIDVESEPGKGSVFYVFLPASSGTVAPEANTARIHKGSGTIVVMDDEAVVRETFRKVLELLGYSVICKNNGREVVEFVENGPQNSRFVAMIFDLTVPGGMGGIETVKEIRKIKKDIPVFVVSGYADTSVMNNPAGYGFTASLSKPFTIADVSELLEKYLSKQK